MKQEDWSKKKELGEVLFISAIKQVEIILERHGVPVGFIHWVADTLRREYRDME